MASNTVRNPSIGMSGAFDLRYNVIFNWHHRTIDGGDETSVINLINNYFKPVPVTNENMLTVFVCIKQRSQYSPGSAWAEGGWFPKAPNRPGKWYVAGNMLFGSAAATADNRARMRAKLVVPPAKKKS